MQINGENEMGTFMLYLIVIALLVMVYLLWEIRTAITNMSGQLGALVRIQQDQEAERNQDKC